MSKDSKLIKSKFGKKFLDVFQKSLLETMSKNRNDIGNALFFPYSAKSNLAGEVPQLMVNNYENYKSIYKINKNSSNQDLIPVDSLGYNELKGTSGFYPQDILKNYDRRNLNQLGLPQKLWSSGRPRGSLERFSGQPRSKNLFIEPQGLYSGIQGTSLLPHHRDLKTLEVMNTHEKLQEPQSTKEQTKSIPNEQLLKAIEKLSKKFGTPFNIHGHKEEFVNIISNDKTLQAKFIKFNSKPKSLHVTAPPTANENRKDLIIKNPLSNLNVKELAINNEAIRADQQLPHRKYLLTYLCATENEKEKIVNMFHKMFKEYTFNAKEEKELILRHIR